jgi:hypothetical protein
VSVGKPLASFDRGLQPSYRLQDLPGERATSFIAVGHARDALLVASAPVRLNRPSVPDSLQKRISDLPSFCFKRFEAGFKFTNSLPDLNVLDLRKRLKTGGLMLSEWN